MVYDRVRLGKYYSTSSRVSYGKRDSTSPTLSLTFLSPKTCQGGAIQHIQYTHTVDLNITVRKAHIQAQIKASRQIPLETQDRAANIMIHAYLCRFSTFIILFFHARWSLKLLTPLSVKTQTIWSWNVMVFLSTNILLLSRCIFVTSIIIAAIFPRVLTSGAYLFVFTSPICLQILSYKMGSPVWSNRQISIYYRYNRFPIITVIQPLSKFGHKANNGLFSTAIIAFSGV